MLLGLGDLPNSVPPNQKKAALLILPYLGPLHLLAFSPSLLLRQFWQDDPSCFAVLFFLLPFGHGCLQFSSAVQPKYRLSFLQEPRNAIPAVSLISLVFFFLHNALLSLISPFFPLSVDMQFLQMQPESPSVTTNALSHQRATVCKGLQFLFGAERYPK